MFNFLTLWFNEVLFNACKEIFAYSKALEYSSMPPSKSCLSHLDLQSLWNSFFCIVSG